MVKNIFLFICLSLFGISYSFAQDISYGFKAGLNFSKINTEDIEQLDNVDLESFDQNSGFHLGIVFNTKFSEYFGARGEFLFSQKGGRYEFEGPSYTDLNSFLGGDKVSRTGFRKMNLNISNAYIDIPVSVVVRPLEWFELSAGVNAAILISSSAAGEMSFREDSQSEEDAYKGISLDFRYFRDEVGETIPENGSEVRLINGTSLEIPKTIKAYYDFPEGAETGLFNRFDFGLHATANFFINKSLFVGARINYGLADITNSRADRSLVAKDGSELILREDKDTNLSLQASIGFSF